MSGKMWMMQFSKHGGEMKILIKKARKKIFRFFEEFLEALDGDLYQEWQRLPLPEADDCCSEVYEKLRLAYDQYCQIGGYPKVVEAYLERRDILEAQKELVRIIQIFLEESMRYFRDITDISVFTNIFLILSREDDASLWIQGLRLTI